MILKINNQNFDFFNEINIDLKYNSFASAFSFTADFNPDNINHRRLFRPLAYQSVEVINDGQTLLTGTVLNHKFSHDSVPRLISVSGYSRAGVIQDSDIDVDNYPLEFNNVSLVDITEKLIAPFNIALIIDPLVQTGASEVIEKVQAKASQKIGQFINQIAAQKNIVVSHNSAGDIVFTRSNANARSSATYREELPGVLISLDVSGQSMHDRITVFKQADLKNDNAAEETIINPLIGASRPIVKQQNTGSDIDTVQAARNSRAAELRNIKLTIESDRLNWYNGQRLELIAPNRIITVISPNNYIFNPTNFFVESVKMKLTNESETATISAVLPQVYNDQNPRAIF